MENAPNIILFGYFAIVILVIIIALMIIGVLLIKRSEKQRSKRLRFWGRICVSLSIICSIPIVLSIGYILYLYIG